MSGPSQPATPLRAPWSHWARRNRSIASRSANWRVRPGSPGQHSHYASRSAYLETAYANMMASSALKAATLPEGQGQVLATSLILDHLHQSRAFAVSVEQSRDRPRMLAAGELRLRTIAEDNLASLLPDIDPRHRRAAATFIVGGFMGLLRQWTATGLQEPPAAIRHRFETMARSVVEGLKR